MSRWLVLALMGLVGAGSASCHLIVSFDAPVTASDAAVADHGAEDCTNGTDDDGDGLVDCADPDCQPDYTCVAEAPSGFTLDYVARSMETSCPGAGPPTAMFSPGTPTCDVTGCSCGPPSGACTVAASLFSSSCMGGSSTSVQMVDGTCYSTAGTGTSGAFTGSGANVTCAPSGTATTTSGAMAAPVTLCPAAPKPAGCAAGQVCVRKPSGAFGAVCAVATGSQTCPAELPTRDVIGSAFNDLRSCTCGCSGSTSCSITQVNVYDGSNCTGGSDTIAANSKCKVFGVTAASMRIRPNSTPSGCTPAATLTGVFKAYDETTVCCPP